MKVSGKVGDGPMNDWLNFGGDPDHRLDTGIVFRIRHYWEIRKMVSTDCAAQRCRAGHALAGIAIATTTSLRHRPLADVYTVPVLSFVIVSAKNPVCLPVVQLLLWLQLRQLITLSFLWLQTALASHCTIVVCGICLRCASQAQIHCSSSL